MNKYKIAVSWEMFGEMEIVADSLEEAIKIAEEEDDSLPEGNYLDGSFLVDEQMSIYLNE